MSQGPPRRGRGGHASPGRSTHHHPSTQRTQDAVLLVGAGFLGQAIAGELARRGCTVYVYDREPAQTNRVLAKASENYWADEDKSPVMMSQQEAAAALGRLHVSQESGLDEFVATIPKTGPGAIRFVFEAVVENMGIKQSVLQHLDTLFPEEVVFCSNSMNFDIDDITQKMAHHRARVVGVRFLSPVFYMPRVEVSLGRSTTGSRAFTTVWNALTRWGFAPFLFHFGPGAPRERLERDQVSGFLASQENTYKARLAMERGTRSSQKTECRFGQHCYFINDAAHLSVYTHGTADGPRLPCRWGGLCHRMDDQEHRDNLWHPPACTWARECTKLHIFPHRASFVHPSIPCRYGGRCTELSYSLHCSLFTHSPATPTNGLVPVQGQGQGQRGHGHGDRNNTHGSGHGGSNYPQGHGQVQRGHDERNNTHGSGHGSYNNPQGHGHGQVQRGHEQGERNSTQGSGRGGFNNPQGHGHGPVQRGHEHGDRNSTQGSGHGGYNSPHRHGHNNAHAHALAPRLQPSHGRAPVLGHGGHGEPVHPSPQGVPTTTTTAAAATMVKSENEDEAEESGDSECVVCFDRAKEALLYPCGHVAVCLDCGQRIKADKGVCPICRTAIEGVVKMFFA